MEKSIGYFARYAIMALLLALAMSPAVAGAQATTTTLDVASSTHVYSRFHNRDGSDLPIDVRQQQIKEYRQQSSNLQQKIAALGGIASASVLMPILFGVEVKDISPNFGDPRDGGARLHEGEDIMAVKGTPIVSPTPAVVIRVDYGAGEGNAVYTANPGGETFVYYHLDRVGEGVVSGLALGQGSLIGYVGNTGNASGGAAHLHFEIHNSSGVPVDPFPRLTGEFSLNEKISYLSAILAQTSDSVALAQFLVSNFRVTFVAAMAANIALPVFIIDALASIPATIAPVSATGNPTTGDLDIGSSGSAVIALQKYLIQSATGPAAARLAMAGATGYFGAITKVALVEYQATVNGSVVALARNLYLGISGEDVRTLQKLLNANGYMVAVTGYGSLGNETIYFGPATKAAVIKFQIARGISPIAGYVGPITRAALASL